MLSSTVSFITVFLWLCLFVPLVSGVVEGVDGGSVVLPCTLTSKGDLTWTRGTDVILIKPANGSVIIQNGLYKGDVSLVNGDDLRISPVMKSRDGDGGGGGGGVGDQVFKCAYSGGGTQQIQLRLLARITGVSINEAKDKKVTVTAGTPVTLTCSVTGVPDPSPSYTWSIRDVTANGLTPNSFTFTPKKSMKTIKCTARNRYSNGSVLSEKEATATLNVLSKITGVSITEASNRIVTVIAGIPITLTCSAAGDPNPLPSYSWSVNCVTNSGPTSSSCTFTPDKSMTTIKCTATNRYLDGSVFSVKDATARLNVLYPPDVTVSYDNTTQTLTCTAEGVPRNYNFSPWEHRLDGKLLQSLGTQSSGSTATLNLPDTLNYEDTGYYICQASNGIKSPQKGQLFISPQTPAIFEDQRSRQSLVIGGEVDTISIPFYTYSDTPDVKVLWTKSGESTVLTSHREQTSPVRVTIHGQNVNMDGAITVLTVRNVDQSDEGNYTVTVTNDINGVSQSSQIIISVYIKIPSSTESVNRNPDDTNIRGNIGGAVGGGIAAVVVVIIIVIAALVLFRKNRMISEGTVRNPHELTVAQFQNSRQEGGVYQDLARNPDYESATDNQPYARLDTKGRGDGDYEQCDVTVNETNQTDGHVASRAVQYEDVSFSSDEGYTEHQEIANGDPETTDYVNKAFQAEASKTCYNL